MNRPKPNYTELIANAPQEMQDAFDFWEHPVWEKGSDDELEEH